MQMRTFIVQNLYPENNVVGRMTRFEWFLLSPAVKTRVKEPGSNMNGT